MHMADALLSPAVGGVMWAVSAATIARCSATLRREADDREVPLMGVLGAFLFAAQMINFSVPGTGSSGHLGGGLLLAILLGPGAAFLTIASVLVIQALFFADGGLLALGCNILNMGLIPAFLVYPLCYRKLAGADPGRARLAAATVFSAVVALQLGSLAVVLETAASGISSLPVAGFLLLMQPIHLAIGVIEGVVTVAVVSFVRKARPDILHEVREDSLPVRRPIRRLLLVVLLAAALTGGVLSAFASKNPDGLEWSIAKVTGRGGLGTPGTWLHRSLGALQDGISLLPGYHFRGQQERVAPAPVQPQTRGRGFGSGTALSGLLGSLATLLFALLGGVILKKRNCRNL